MVGGTKHAQSLAVVGRADGLAHPANRHLYCNSGLTVLDTRAREGGLYKVSFDK